MRPEILVPSGQVTVIFFASENIFVTNACFIINGIRTAATPNS